MNIIQHKTGATYSSNCIVSNMPNDEYHAHAGISNSGLTRFSVSPAHYKYAPKNEPTRAMEIGTAIHAAILEPERFKSQYMLLPEVKARTATEYKKAAATLGSELVLIGNEVSNVLGMYESVHSSEYIHNRLSESGHTELSVFAIDPETGVLCKCRFDYLSDTLRAIDVKKTQDARPEPFSRSIDNYRYHVQAAFYSDVFKWCTGKELKSFEFLAVEEKQPHGRKLYKLCDESLDIGRRMYRENLSEYAECLANNYWPLYECDDSELISLPYWTLSKYENDLIEGIV